MYMGKNENNKNNDKNHANSERDVDRKNMKKKRVREREE